ncbi:hypothetical protein ACFWA4_41220, partial [Streptomyces sp. NPDC060011]|uniref:hypothetical protein n=1 Tax=Streptomyces sp. NPDC060011 TaxID=3347037 RepID=UPI00367BBA4F
MSGRTTAPAADGSAAPATGRRAVFPTGRTGTRTDRTDPTTSETVRSTPSVAGRRSTARPGCALPGDVPRPEWAVVRLRGRGEAGVDVGAPTA